MASQVALQVKTTQLVHWFTHLRNKFTMIYHTTSSVQYLIFIQLCQVHFHTVSLVRGLAKGRATPWGWGGLWGGLWTMGGLRPGNMRILLGLDLTIANLPYAHSSWRHSCFRINRFKKLPICLFPPCQLRKSSRIAGFIHTWHMYI